MFLWKTGKLTTTTSTLTSLLYYTKSTPAGNTTTKTPAGNMRTERPVGNTMMKISAGTAQATMSNTEWEAHCKGLLACIPSD